MQKKILESRPLFKECLEALNTQLLPETESDNLSKLFNELFPITEWGKIDWDKLPNKIDIGCEPLNIIPALEQLLNNKSFDQSVYIEWSTGGLPIIESNLSNIINHFDDVTCVAFEKFIFNPNLGYIIEILPGDQMTVGIVNLRDC